MATDCLVQMALLTCLVVMAVADWRQRSVSVASLLLYGCLLLWSLKNDYPPSASWTESKINTVFLLVQFATVGVLLRLKNGSFNLTKSIGAGDLIFLLLSAIGWSTTFFLAAYLTGLVLALLLALVQQRGVPDQHFPIPLLTAMGVSFSLFILVFW